MNLISPTKNIGIIDADVVGVEPTTLTLGGSHAILIYLLYTFYQMCIRGVEQ